MDSTYLLLFVSLSFLTNNNDEVFLTLFLELSHLGLGILQFYRHLLHLLSCVVYLT